MLPSGATTTNNVATNEMSTMSLWLLPPAPLRHDLKRTIARLSQQTPGASVPFEPHVTVVGGIPCRNKDHAQQIVQSLQEGFFQFGAVPCEFYETPRRCRPGHCTSDDNFNEEISQPYVWNQAFVMEMYIGEKFKNLCQLAYEILERPLEGNNSQNKEISFPKPLKRPHLSLVYAERVVPRNDQVEPIPTFHSTQLALWNTSPPTLEGVKYWTQIAVIDLV